MPSLRRDDNGERNNPRGVAKAPVLGATELLLSRVLIVGIGPLISLLVVRYLGPKEYGLYASASAVTSLLAVLCDFGLQQASLKVASQPKSELPSVIRGAVRIGWVFSSVAFLGVFLWVTIIPRYEPVVSAMALIGAAAFPCIPLRSLITVALQVRAEYNRIAWWNLVASTAQWSGVLIVVAFRLGATALVIAHTIGMWISTVSQWVIEGQRLGLRNQTPDAIVPARLILKDVWVFGIGNVMYETYHRSSLAILSAIRPPVEVGYYSVTFRIVELAYILPSVVFNEVLFPRYFSWRFTNRQRLGLYYRMMTKGIAYVGLFVASMLVIFAAEIVQVVFGVAEPRVARLLGIMAWAVPARYWASSAGAVLLTDGHMAIRVRNQGIAAVGNVALNLTMVPKAGVTAAAMVMVATEVAMLLLHTLGLQAATRLTLSLGKSGSLALSVGSLSVLAAGATASAGPLVLRLLLGVGLALSLVVLAVVTMRPDERAELKRLTGQFAELASMG